MFNISPAFHFARISRMPSYILDPFMIIVGLVCIYSGISTIWRIIKRRTRYTAMAQGTFIKVEPIPRKPLDRYAHDRVIYEYSVNYITYHAHFRTLHSYTDKKVSTFPQQVTIMYDPSQPQKNWIKRDVLAEKLWVQIFYVALWLILGAWGIYLTISQYF